MNAEKKSAEEKFRSMQADMKTKEDDNALLEDEIKNIENQFSEMKQTAEAKLAETLKDLEESRKAE